MDYELGIIGAGPAGLSASIYAVRAGIKTIVFDKGIGGGLAAIAPNIENYLGFKSISGIDLIEKMKEHASLYINVNYSECVEKIKKENNAFLIKTDKKEYSVKSVLFCMGTKYRKLDVPGEKELQGKGVSYCATCDGFFFKNRRVVVIGGGNSALIEAIYLKQIGCKEVYVIHRRNMLRAERAYVDEAIKKGVKIIYETRVTSINGKDKVDYLELDNIKTGEKTKFEVDGVFISIGEEPQSSLAKEMGIKLDEKGYIIIDRQGRTNITGVYAAGDITGGLRQVITSAAEGAVAALTTTETTGKKYPY